MTPPTANCPACYRSVPVSRGRLTGHYRPNTAQQCPGTGRQTAPPPPLRNPARDLLTVPQVAAVLTVSKMTVYRLIERQELRALRIGTSLRVRPEDVDQFLTDAEVGK